MTVKVTKPEFLSEDELQEILNFLDDLRGSGKVNMFAAPQLVEYEFPTQVDRHKSREVVKYWMNTYGERHAQAATREGVE